MKLPLVFCRGQIANSRAPIRLLSIDHDGGLPRMLGMDAEGPEIEGCCQRLDSLLEQVETDALEAAVVSLAELRQTVDAIRRLRLRHPEIGLVAIGEHSKANLRACIAAGADTLVVRGTQPDDVKRTIKMLVKKEPRWNPEVTFQVLVHLSALSRSLSWLKKCPLELSHREIEILELINADMTNKAIASKLFISIHTVKNHVHNILKKLKKKNRYEAADEAVRNGWLYPARDPGGCF